MRIDSLNCDFMGILSQLTNEENYFQDVSSDAYDIMSLFLSSSDQVKGESISKVIKSSLVPFKETYILLKILPFLYFS
jgi:hypothetical protein